MSDLPPLLEGRWQMVRAELNGMAAPDFVARKTEISFRAGLYEVSFDGQITDRGSYSLHSSGGTKTMTLTGDEGPNAGRTIPCLYQIVGERLRVCYGLGGVEPTGFAAAYGYLATYRRT